VVKRKARSEYDDIAGIYHVLWADWYLPAAAPALQQLLFSRLPPPARVLDVCCGSGHVTRELVRRGYQVTGIDSSAALIAVAREELPDADFRVQDARALKLEKRYQAAISTFDSLNHMLSLDDLREVFAGVRQVLEPHGFFVFDMNLEEAYTADLRQWSVTVEEQEIALVRGLYDFETRFAETEVIWFLRAEGKDCWHRHRSIVKERCYPKSEILDALSEAGFGKSDAFNAEELGVSAGLGFGRIFILART